MRLAPPVSHFRPSGVPETEKYLAFPKHFRTLDLIVVGLAIGRATLAAQQPISRQQAIDAAVTRGARAAVARADTLIGAAGVVSARQWENPSVSLTFFSSRRRHTRLSCDWSSDVC